MLKNLKRAQEWPNLQKVGLHPNIQNFEQYAQLVALGEAMASVMVVEASEPMISVSDISVMHFTMFCMVHPWAGHFSQIGEDTWIGGMLSCDPRFIVQELEQLEQETRTIASAKTIAAYARAMAFFHAKFERIHPFKDGNGRVGRLLLEAQMNVWFGLNPQRGEVVPKEYYAALADAQRKSNLRPLMNLILKLDAHPSLPKGYDPLPFRLSPYQGDMLDPVALRERVIRRKLAKNR